MVKKRRELSLDSDVDKLLDEKTAVGEILVSRYINNHFREKYKDELKNMKK